MAVFAGYDPFRSKEIVSHVVSHVSVSTAVVSSSHSTIVSSDIKSVRSASVTSTAEAYGINLGMKGGQL